MVAIEHIYHPDLTPTTPVATPYVPGPDVALWRSNSDQSIVQEIHQRPEGTLGVRYHTWVNFQDAGGGGHHLWNDYFPRAAVITDSTERAKELAAAHAEDCGLVFGEWHRHV
jgi:hypothetical protein